jgi:hypothetical protein
MTPTAREGAAFRAARIPLGAMLAILAIGMAGCGNGEALSKQEYVAELNAMCEDFSLDDRNSK